MPLPLRTLLRISLGIALLSGRPALAEQGSSGAAGVAQSGSAVLEEVEVIAPRLDLQISPYIDPDMAIGADAISAMAVNDLGELLEQLAPELDGGRGRGTSSRVILLNGQRIANFREIRRYPAEAILRVDIYPEDVALQYGFRADQKVVNIVLKNQFRSLTTRVTSTGYGDDEKGQGGEVVEADAGYLKVRESARANLDLDIERQTALHEADRDVPLPPTVAPASLDGNVFALGEELDAALSETAGMPVTSATLPAGALAPDLSGLLATANAPLTTDQRPFRTLLPELEDQSFSGGYANLWGERVTATLSGAYRQRELRTEQGLATLSYDVPGVHPESPFSADVQVHRLLPRILERSEDSERFELNAGLAGSWLGIDLSWLSSYTREQRDAVTLLGVDEQPLRDRIAALEPGLDPFAVPPDLEPVTQRDDTVIDAWSSELLARGVFRELPAGPVQGSIRALWEYNTQRATSERDTGVRRSSIERRVTGLRGNLDVPLREFAGGARLSLNMNGDYAHYSDFGGLATVGAGLSWNPGAALRVTSSLTREENPPGMEQLGNPVTPLPNQRSFDFVTGAPVAVTQLSGGNPQLEAEIRHLWNINARVRLPRVPSLTLTFDYLQEITEQPIARFPQPTAELEAAFPQRFERDARGNLILVDTRAVNLDEARRREFRWALRYSHEFQRAGAGERGQRSARGRGGSSTVPGFLRRRSSTDGPPRLRLSMNHTITLEDELTLIPGSEPIDFLGTAEAGRLRNGAEHSINLRSSFAYRGFSTRLNARWQSATETRPGAGGALRFEDLLQADLNVAYSVQPQSGLAQRYPALAGSRLRFSVFNMLDSKTRVFDGDGLTPAGFWEDELMPRGRHFALEFRKQFR